MSEWQPIETYDAMKVKPNFAVFLFREEHGRSFSLYSTMQTTRHYGNRVCVLWIPLPEPPK